MITRGNRTLLTTLGFLLIAGFFLTTEHRAHVLGILPFLLILACPLLHMSMHGGHGGHENHGPSDEGSGSRTKTITRDDPHSGHGAAREDIR